jgi:prepilin-type N-terminal cleavage/methylation domain-containing protein
MHFSLRPSSVPRKNLGFSLPEILIVVVILGILATTAISISVQELRRNKVQKAANTLAGWLDSAARAAQRGQGCLVSIPSTTVTTGNSAATIQSDTTTTPSSAIINQCALIGNLSFDNISDGSSFSITTAPVSSIVFTPRGTIFNPADPSGIFGQNIRVTINVFQAGSAQPPSSCVVITPPLGQIRAERC